MTSHNSNSYSEDEDDYARLSWEKEKTSRLEERLISKETLICQMKIYNNDLCSTIQHNNHEVNILRDLLEKDALEVEVLEELMKEQQMARPSSSSKKNYETGFDIASVSSDFEFLQKENHKLLKQKAELEHKLEKIINEPSNIDEIKSNKYSNEYAERIEELETEISKAKQRNDELKKKFNFLKEEIKIIETEKELISIRFNEQQKEQNFDQSSMINKLMKMKEESLVRTQSQIKRIEREIEKINKENMVLKSWLKGN